MRICYFLMLTILSDLLCAQTTVAFQGGEGTAADTWGFAAITNAGGAVPPGAVTGVSRTGTKSIRAAGGNNVGCSGGSNCITGGSNNATGCSMHGNTISFNAINVACLSGVQLTCYHSSHSCSGSGFDSGESLLFQVRLNGGAWTTSATLTGSGDLTWTYATTTAGGAPNPFVYNVPAGTNTFEFRVVGNTNRADEVFYVDDVKLTTTTTGYAYPGTAGLWGGYVSTDWFNGCNWNDRTIPTAATNVVFPSNNTGARDIVINAGTNPVCNNLTINGSGSKQVKGEGSATKKLTINGNLTISSTDGLDFSDGTTGSADGTIELYGNWINSGIESDFKEGNSIVKFMGTANQSISTADAQEAFYGLTINKAAGIVTMNDNVWIDKDIEGGTNPLLIFTQGNLDLNSKQLKIWNDNEQAVSRVAGGVISEDANNSSKMSWLINTNTGPHVFPFIRTDNFYIPFTFNLTAGDADELIVSTYPTAANNMPYPVTPQTVTNVNNPAGTDNSAYTINRFWQIDKTGPSGTAGLTFTYGDNEWDVTEFGDYEAQRWNGTAWQPAVGGQVQNTAANSVSVPGVTVFSPWTLASRLNPLPIELVEFNAYYNDHDEVEQVWITTSEINNAYFTVERSSDGISFEPVYNQTGAGNYLGNLHYKGKDLSPFTGISYYRLRQTDFNGSYSYSQIVSVEKNTGDWLAGCYMDATGPVVKFNSSVPENAIIYIFNSTGQLLTAEKAIQVNQKIDTPPLAPGIYFVRIVTSSKSKSIKLLVSQ